MTYSEVEEVSGFIGNFKVKVRKKARFVDASKCNGCGICMEKCPWKADSEFDLGLSQRKAIYTPFPQAVPNVPVIDKESCAYFLKGKCRACEKYCEREAIDFEQQDKIAEIDVGNIILTTGYDPFDPTPIVKYGYGRLPNVVTGLEFERICNSVGPTGGKIVLKDGSEPKSIAIIHCVGSRDENYHEYCSRVCCMYALKYSHLIKEKTKADVYQMYIDMRCFGKGYEEFYKRLSKEGVTFIRGKPAEVTDRAQNDEEKGKLIVVGEDSLLGTVVRVPVDMVILCIALEARADAKNVAHKFGISQGADGFFIERHPKLDPVATMTEGVFIAGCCQSPKDIPDTVAQASAAAARVLALISKGKVELEAAVALIDEEKCSGCRICNLLCPYNAIDFIEKDEVSRINEALCKGCGTCVAACPSAAITHKHFTTEEIMAEIEGVLV
jgi:heterodisulfide reductase subunit A